MELKKAPKIIQPIIQNQNHATSYLWPRGRTHTQTHTYPHERRFQETKPMCTWNTPGLKRVSLVII